MHTFIIIVLGVLLFVSLVIKEFVSWRLCHHLRGKKENTRKDKPQENIELAEEKNAVNALYSAVTSVESHHQGQQHMSAFYENSDVAQMKKEEEHGAYEEIGQVRRFISFVK